MRPRSCPYYILERNPRRYLYDLSKFVFLKLCVIYICRTGFYPFYVICILLSLFFIYSFSDGKKLFLFTQSKNFWSCHFSACLTANQPKRLFWHFPLSLILRTKSPTKWSKTKIVNASKKGLYACVKWPRRIPVIFVEEAQH